MKIRTITVGFVLFEDDLVDAVTGKSTILEAKIADIRENVKNLEKIFQEYGYQIQTIRLYFNSFEEWLIPSVEKFHLTVESVILYLDKLLGKFDVQISNVGPCFGNNLRYRHYINQILAGSTRFSSSVNFIDRRTNAITPNFEDCIEAAKTCKEIHQRLGNLGNFRFCVGFNCPENTPFYPISYVAKNLDNKPSISIGLENGDLIFLAGFAATNLTEARDQLYSTMKQAILPIQKILEEHCPKLDFHFQGVDASINPGLLIQDSVGNGLEQILINTTTHQRDNSILQNPSPDTPLFGKNGTLAVVSAITSALKQLAADPELKLTGYSGLMLPVMEDLILSARAASEPPLYGIRDLLVFSTVCGVGLDTVPIPGDTTVEQIARIYMEVGTLSYRLQKPLSCRLLPMEGLKAGDQTSVDSPYLCNTRVFSVN